MFTKLKFGERVFLLLSGKIGISYKVKNGANIYITPKAGYLLFTPIDSRSPVYLSIRESGLTAAFWDFFQSMDESLFYTTEEAILKLEDLIRRYQKG